MDPKLLAIIYQAGDLALQAQSSLHIKTKPDKSIVTEGDLLVSQFLEKQLAQLFPEFEIFSEENATNKPQGTKIIVIDPIDGTQSYSRQQDTWGILIGFIEDGVFTRGYVYQPTTQQLFYGHKGQGSFLLWQNQTTQLNAHRSGELVAWSSPIKESEVAFLNKLKITHRQTLYSASLKIMKLAQGAGDIYPNFRKKCSLWDLVAPLVILQEAGGNLIFENYPSLPINFDNPHINSRFYAVGPRLLTHNFFTE